LIRHCGGLVLVPLVMLEPAECDGGFDGAVGVPA
jgi:hypothetical protein